MMKRIRNTFEKLILIRHWKFEYPYFKNNVKVSTESSFSSFHQIDISDIKHFVRCEVWRYTKAGNTDQL